MLNNSYFESQKVTVSRLRIDAYDVPKNHEIIVYVTFGDFIESQRNALRTDRKYLRAR